MGYIDIDIYIYIYGFYTRKRSNGFGEKNSVFGYWTLRVLLGLKRSACIGSMPFGSTRTIAVARLSHRGVGRAIAWMQ